MRFLVFWRKYFRIHYGTLEEVRPPKSRLTDIFGKNILKFRSKDEKRFDKLFVDLELKNFKWLSLKSHTNQRKISLNFIFWKYFLYAKIKILKVFNDSFSPRKPRITYYYVEGWQSFSSKAIQVHFYESNSYEPEI